MGRHRSPVSPNPHVFFSDDFETGDLRKWDNRFDDCDQPALHIVEDPACVHTGRYALEHRLDAGKHVGVSLPVWFMPGYDTVHARWYCQFAPDYDQGWAMHFCRLIGGPPGDYEVVRGRAGTRPTGADFFTTGIEPWRGHGGEFGLGPLVFYTYYPDMAASLDGHYWGRIFTSDPPRAIEPGRWYCLEMMVKCNTPGQLDGEQAAWVDGDPVLHVTGLRWRDTEELKIHCFRLHLHIHDNPRVNRVWFDNVVLSAQYVGPMEK